MVTSEFIFFYHPKSERCNYITELQLVTYLSPSQTCIFMWNTLWSAAFFNFFSPQILLNPSTTKLQPQMNFSVSAPRCEEQKKHDRCLRFFCSFVLPQDATSPCSLYRLWARCRLQSVINLHKKQFTGVMQISGKCHNLTYDFTSHHVLHKHVLWLNKAE